MKKLGYISIGLFLGIMGLVYAFSSETKYSITSTAVMVTNLSGNSGGSGTIMSSHRGHSEILTNGHVCGVVARGGQVVTDDGVRHFVASYKKSQLHDLCLITVAENLKVAARLAESAPAKYSISVISGHPKLLPTIVSHGHFSSKVGISVMTGTRECTDADRQNPATGFFCSFFGMLPVVKTYDSIVTSALIQPGSSGSGIFNSEGELSAVVFAGEGGIGYGFAVPYEYIEQFLRTELSTLSVEFPNTDMQFDASQNRYTVSVEEFSNYCDVMDLNNEICSVVRDASKFNDAMVK